MNNQKSKKFEEELLTIVNEDIREFAIMLLDNAPDYFYIKPASSSGRYHPAMSQGEGGLIRHTKAVVRFLNHILALEQHSKNFSDREMDLMRVACLYHDAEKYGKKEDAVHTVFEHPLLAAETVRGYKSNVWLDDNELEYIAGAIDSHMGQWNTSKKSKEVLPKPVTGEQKLVHLCDYLSSKKDIEVAFDDYEKPPLPDLDTYVLEFGKYKGHLLTSVVSADDGYITWLRENYNREPLASLLKQI